MKKYRKSRRKRWRSAVYVCAFALLVAGLIYSEINILKATVYSSHAQATETWNPKTVTVDGIDYFPRQDITTILVLGIDEEGPVTASGTYRNHGEADAVMLLILNHAEDRVDVLCLNRDTMVSMPVLGIDGRVSGSVYAQLALSHTFGQGLADSCENTQNTIEAFLNNIVIDHYVAVNMDGIPIVNDAVGGVEVTITDDFSKIDSSLKKGPMTLWGQQALTYVQTRKDVGNQLNISRMERHREYMDGLLRAVTDKISADDDFAAQLYEQVSDYIVTDCSVNVISGLLKRGAAYQLGEIVSPEGKNVLTEAYYEFYVNEESLNALILRLFYAPKQ